MLNEVLSQTSFSPRRRWSIGLSVLLSIAALLAVVVMVNYLAARHFRRIPMAASSRQPLTPLTLRLLDSVTNQVKAVVFFNPRNPLFSSVKRVVDEYESRCRKLAVEYVDYVVSPARAEKVREDYKRVWSGDGDRIIFESQGKIKIIYAQDLSEYDYAKILQGEEARRTGFKGEQLFTSAIFSVIDPRPIKAYFLQGHREHDPTSDAEPDGYLSFARILQENNIVVERLSSLSFDEVPADCQLLIMARPLDPLSPVELEGIEKYLNQGGRGFVVFGLRSLGRQTGLERLLASWGVTVGQNWVADLSQAKLGETMLGVIVGSFRDHAIMKALQGSRLSLGVPRSIAQRSSASQSADAAKVAELAVTSPQGVANRADGRTEAKGAIPLMVAVEKGTIQGISADRGATRLVVVGDSSFLGNTMIELAANRDFARNAVNWLLNRDVLLQGIGPHPIKEHRVIMTEGEMSALRWVFLGGFPGAVLFCGFLVWLRRRS